MDDDEHENYIEMTPEVYQAIKLITGYQGKLN